MRKRLMQIVILLMMTILSVCSVKGEDEKVYEPLNPFFFENIGEPIYYDTNYSFPDRDALPDCIELKVTEVEQLNHGILFEMKLDYDEEFQGRDYFGWDRFHLGYFYVQEDSIYLLRNIEVSGIIKNEEDIIKNGILICSNEGVADALGDKQQGWHTYIIEDGDRREYHSYNNETETGFYEAFIWEQGKGLVSYRSGFGAERDVIELQLKDDVGVWEKEFYHCADTLREAIENMEASDIKLPEYDEYVRQRKRQTYLEIWQDYMDFVESWVANDGGTQKEKEEIYRRATLLMVLIDDNHGASYNFYDSNKVYYDFFYDHEQTREELLFVGNQALRRKTPIDIGFERLEEEFESTDYYGERYSLTEDAWEREFYHCMELMQSMVVESPECFEEFVGSSDTLEAWEIYVEQWAEWNEEYATIDAGSGLNIEIALRKRESYRTATLLMIYCLEQCYGEYEFLYDIDSDIENYLLKKEYYGLTFMENPYLCSEIPDELENILGDALINDAIGEFIAENEISYRVLSIEEQKEYANKDCAGVLKDFLYNNPYSADELWLLLSGSETIFIRRLVENNTYEYYGFWVNEYVKSFSYCPAMRALGLEEDYFFIKYEEKEYLITTKRDEGELLGLATYCMNGDALYGGVLYQEKTREGELNTKYWGYTTHGEKHDATYWPEY